MSEDELFSNLFIQKLSLPLDTDFETFENPSDLKNLKPQVNEKNIACNIRYFRNIVLLPPFTVNTILPLDTSYPALIVQSIAAAVQNAKDKIKEDEDFISGEYNEACLYLLSFL